LYFFNSRFRISKTYWDVTFIFFIFFFLNFLILIFHIFFKLNVFLIVKVVISASHMVDILLFSINTKKQWRESIDTNLIKIVFAILIMILFFRGTQSLFYTKRRLIFEPKIETLVFLENIFGELLQFDFQFLNLRVLTQSWNFSDFICISVLQPEREFLSFSKDFDCIGFHTMSVNHVPFLSF